MGRNADAFDFLLGEWDIEMLIMPEGSTVGGRGAPQPGLSVGSTSTHQEGA